MADESFSDFEDDEFDSLYHKTINRTVHETTIRRALPVQRDLERNVLPGQETYYEEVQRDVTFGPTHHVFNTEELDRYIYPTNYEIRDYQYDIVRKAIFTNVLCAIPTGMGKTFIASTLMLNFHRWTTTGKIIFMAPTRPLVAQQIKACLGITGIPNNEAAILLDKSRKNREAIWREKRVFFTTPQVVENDLKRGVLNPKDVVCLVIDEAHRGTGSYAYSNVVQFIDRFNTSYRVLALTATPGATLENVQEVVSNLNISKIELRTEDSPDIVKYMKERRKEKIEVGLTTEIEDIIEQIGIAITPALKQAVELGIYDECEPSQINAFKAMLRSQKIIANPSIPEGIKWRNFFILQLLNHVGQMLKRIKIYGIKTFYSYFQNKYKEFTTKYGLGKSTNKIAAAFYYHPILKTLMSQCDNYMKDSSFLGHEKLQHVQDELSSFFEENQMESRVIIFTELRESALEIVKCIDGMNDHHIRPHIFIGQAKGKEGFDEVSFTRKNKPKGRKKTDRMKRLEEEARIDEERKQQKELEKLERSARRTASSEEAQIHGMTQKQQKEVISNFKRGDYNVLVCTSIGEEGLDIGEVDLIICYDTTSSPIKNIQRMGRTGRKRDGNIILLFSSNESYKFQQAMEDYENLQKLIVQNYITYKESDRILPTNIIPKCEEKFITVSEEDQELNNIDDTDEVIRYATQCMLGKPPKVKKKTIMSKKAVEPKKSIKRFFMPDNVETGIISASNLVNKIALDENGTKHTINEPQVKIRKVKRESTPIMLPTLDKLEKDSLSSGDEFFDDCLGSKQDGEQLHSSGSKDIVKSEGNDGINSSLLPSLPSSLPPSRLKSTSTPKSFNIKQENSILLYPSLSSDVNSSSAEGGIVIPSVKKETIVREGTTNNINDQSSMPLYNVNVTNEIDEYIQRHYHSEAESSISTIPSLQENTKCGRLPHSLQITRTLNLFNGMKTNDRKSIIEMNRIKCIAKRIETGKLSEGDQTSSLLGKTLENSSSVSQGNGNADDDDDDKNNRNSSILTDTSMESSYGRMEESKNVHSKEEDALLDELLGSDSDLEGL